MKGDWDLGSSSQVITHTQKKRSLKDNVILSHMDMEVFPWPRENAEEEDVKVDDSDWCVKQLHPMCKD